MVDEKSAVKSAAQTDSKSVNSNNINSNITLSKEEYDALLRKSNRASATTIAKEDLLKALEGGRSIYAASKVLGKSYISIKSAIEKYGIDYKPVPRIKSGVIRKVKSYTLSDDELTIVNSIVFALKNRPQMLDKLKAIAEDAMKI